MITLESLVDCGKNEFGIVKGFSSSIEGIIWIVRLFETKEEKKFTTEELRETTKKEIEDYCYKKIGYIRLN